jgi:hypothetical protein
MPTALAQDSSDRERGVTYALRPGKPEISINGVTEQSFWHNQFFSGLLVRWQ